ncbi:MAG: hypothetical protein RR441_09460 [Longicatena sp.]
MFFLSFQEWLTYHGKTLQEVNEKDCMEDYVILYLRYCKIHHIYSNLYDVFFEQDS